MELFLSAEAEKNATDILLNLWENEIHKKLEFITKRDIGLEEIDNYGKEFKNIGIITIILSKQWIDYGYKERRYISRKNKEADIRLYIDYERFINETPENQRLLYIKNIIDSINVVIEKSKGDFRGEELKKDILNALNVTQEQLDRL